MKDGVIVIIMVTHLSPDVLIGYYAPNTRDFEFKRSSFKAGGIILIYRGSSELRSTTAFCDWTVGIDF